MLDQRDMLGEQKTNCALRAAAEWHESPGRETDGPDQIDGANRRPPRAPVYFTVVGHNETVIGEIDSAK
jgi:hypothetical protein